MLPLNEVWIMDSSHGGSGSVQIANAIRVPYVGRNICGQLCTTIYSQMLEYSCGLTKKQIRVTAGNFLCGFVFSFLHVNRAGRQYTYIRM